MHPRGGIGAESAILDRGLLLPRRGSLRARWFGCVMSAVHIGGAGRRNLTTPRGDVELQRGLSCPPSPSPSEKEKAGCARIARDVITTVARILAVVTCTQIMLSLAWTAMVNVLPRAPSPIRTPASCTHRQDLRKPPAPGPDRRFLANIRERTMAFGIQARNAVGQITKTGFERTQQVQ